MKGFSYESGSKERVCLLKGLVLVHKRAGPELSAKSCTVSRVKGAQGYPAVEWRCFFGAIWVVPRTLSVP